MSKMHLAGPSITQLEMDYVQKAMSDWYETPYYFCEEFQDRFADYTGRKYALMTPNCTTAVHLTLASLGVGAGDEVIVPECTWIGSSAGITYVGAKTVFADIDPDDWCMSPTSLAQRITDRTKAIIVVNVFGNMAKMTKLQEIADTHGIPLIEDAAESVGSSLKGKISGSNGIASVFSFHRTKTITTGEGGILLTDDEELFERAGFLRDHGRRSDGPMYFNYEVTFKYMPFNVQAALGLAQLERVDELVAIKQRILHRYKSNLSDFPEFQFNIETKEIVNGAWVTALCPPASFPLSKLELISALQDLNQPCRPFFYPLSSLPAYGSQDLSKENVNAYQICHRGVNLPSAMNIEDSQIDEYCERLISIIKRYQY